MQHDAYIRRAAIRAHIPYETTMAAAHAAAVGIAQIRRDGNSDVKSLQELHSSLRQA